MNDERLAELMVRVADGIATPAEQQELKQHMQEQPELAVELEGHMKIKSIADGWGQRLELDLVEDAQQKQRKTENWIGVSLILAGIAVLSAFGLVEFWSAPDVPPWLKAGYGLCGAGVILLLFSTIRHRMTTIKKDKYTEIQR